MIAFDGWGLQMAWEFGKQTSDVGTIGVRLCPDEVLYFYDAPSLFTSSICNFRSLVLKVDENDTHDLYISSVISEETLSGLKACVIPILDALSVNDHWILETTKDRVVTRHWTCSPDRTPQWLLPYSGIMLRPSPTHGDVHL